MHLLQKLCETFGPSGNEDEIKDFLLHHIQPNTQRWKVQPEIFHGEEFQNCIVLVFGKPRTAIFAHIDTIGYTVRYNKQLVPIGGPHSKTGYKLWGKDSQGEVECTLQAEEEGNLHYESTREIDRATNLIFKCDFRETEDSVQSCYLDNRLGVYAALKVAETLENGIIVFSCWEEHGGGSVPYLAKFIYEDYGVKQALISDITWVTEGVRPGEGVAISMRDRSIPRRHFLDRVVEIAKHSHVPYQLEVEEYGGSDGKELQSSPYPFDWCFVGAPEENVHTPDEKVHKNDIASMIEMYKVLMANL
ncbi:MAG TPA: M20/M25/M40 family metallo-hydrolase [Cytophagaceae bacterium]|jgi:putative aminopeptidase FrvX